MTSRVPVARRYDSVGRWPLATYRQVMPVSANGRSIQSRGADV